MDVVLQDLGRAIKRLQHRHHGRLDAGMSVIGTTLAQWDALRAIQNNPGASGHVLAMLTYQTDQSFGALINKLVNQRHIDRHSGVGRALFYTLTDEGRRIAREGTEVVESVLETSFEPLSATERGRLFALLTKVLADDGPARSVRARTG